jgi:hypothetical protein
VKRPGHEIDRSPPSVAEVNKEYCLEVMKCLRKAVRRKRPESWKEKKKRHSIITKLPHVACFLFVTVSQSTGRTRATTSVLARSRTSRLLFVPEAEFTLKDRHFGSVENSQENSLAKLRAVPQKAFQKCFQN